MIPPNQLLLSCLVFIFSCSVGTVVYDNEDPNNNERTGNETPQTEGNGGAENELPSPSETLAVTFTTQELGDRYAPENIVAAWIEDANGDFVKTIGRWAGVRAQHLVAWANASGQDVDAVSGATRRSHADELVATWNIDSVTPDGIYTLRVEVSEQNSTTPGENSQSSFTFEKNGTAAIQSPNAQGLASIELDYSGRE